MFRPIHYLPYSVIIADTLQVLLFVCPTFSELRLYVCCHTSFKYFSKADSTLWKQMNQKGAFKVRGREMERVINKIPKTTGG